MRSLYSSTLVAIGAVSALTLAALPSQAQFVSIPVSNGNFVISTDAMGVTTYTTLPTFLSPAGTLTITAAGVGSTNYQSPTPVTVNTPVGVMDIGSYAGSAMSNDGRTATFTNAGVSLRGTATITGAANIPATGGAFVGFGGNLPNGASFAYTVQSGAVHIPAASVSAYPTTQFTIPVSGGSFTLTDPTGTGNATVTINSLLTPLGTANVTLSSPNLSRAAGFPFAFYPMPALTVNLGGLANGTVALNDGRTATVTNRLTHLTANTQVVVLPPGNYIQGATILATPVTITGTITSGSISVPESAVSPFPPAPVQPPVQPPVVQPPVVQPPVVQLPVQPPKQEFALGFATNVNLGGEPTEYLKLVEVEPVPVSPEDLPEVEASPLAYSRIHPGVNAYNR